MKLRVEYTYDSESHDWCFVVPSLGIIGGADTREAAEEEAVSAIAFTLEGENDTPIPPDSEVAYLQVRVTKSSSTAGRRAG